MMDWVCWVRERWMSRNSTSSSLACVTGWCDFIEITVEEKLVWMWVYVRKDHEFGMRLVGLKCLWDSQGEILSRHLRLYIWNSDKKSETWDRILKSVFVDNLLRLSSTVSDRKSKITRAWERRFFLHKSLVQGCSIEIQCKSCMQLKFL